MNLFYVKFLLLTKISNEHARILGTWSISLIYDDEKTEFPEKGRVKRNGFSSYDRLLLVCSISVGPRVFPTLCSFSLYSWPFQIFALHLIEIDLLIGTV